METLQIKRGGTFRRTLEFLGEDDEAFPLTGLDLRAVLVRNVGDTTALAECDIEDRDDAGGTCDLVIDAATMEEIDPGAAYLDVRATETGTPDEVWYTETVKVQIMPRATYPET